MLAAHSDAAIVDDGTLPPSGKGGKNRRRGKNENDEKRELVFKEDGQGIGPLYILLSSLPKLYFISGCGRRSLRLACLSSLHAFLLTKHLAIFILRLATNSPNFLFRAEYAQVLRMLGTPQPALPCVSFYFALPPGEGLSVLVSFQRLFSGTSRY